MQHGFMCVDVFVMNRKHSSVLVSFALRAVSDHFAVAQTVAGTSCYQ